MERLSWRVRREKESECLQEEFGVAAACGAEQGVSVRGSLGDGFAECKGVAARVFVQEVKVVRGYGCCGL